MLLKLSLFTTLLLSNLFSSSNQVKNFEYNSIKLTLEEKQYLEDLSEIKICIDPSWMPYEKIDHHKHIGMSSDYMKLISKILNLPIRLIPTKNWSQSLEFTKNKICDIIPLLTETPSRRSEFIFTEPYFLFPLVIATDTRQQFISDTKTVLHKRLGIVKGYSFIELLKTKYPSINIIEVDSIEDGFKKVSEGELFGLIDSLSTVAYIIQREYQTQIKIAGKFPESLNIGMGMSKDMKILHSILDKAIKIVPKSTTQNIINRWISVKYETGSFNTNFIIQIFSGIIFIFVIIFIKLYLVRRYNKKLEMEVQQQIEELRKKDIALISQNKLASIGEMVGSIAHQWKQPLNILSLNIELLVEDYEDGLIDEKFIDNFRDENIDVIKFMVETIDDFRNFFRVEKQKDLFDIKNAINKMANMQKVYLEKNRIKLIINNDSFEIFGFQSEFQQVILNIVNNAKDEILKHNIPDGKIKISINSENRDIKIHDNAGGVPIELIEKIFDPYFTTKDIGEGTGIGLYMSKIIVEEHLGGKIYVQNVDDGAEFIIKFGTDQMENKN